MSGVLHERDTELGVVAAAMRAAERGHGCLVVVSGPVGIGKSALLRELPELAERRGARALLASGALLERDFAFGVARQLLEAPLARADEQVRQRWLAGAAGHARLVFTDGLPLREPAEHGCVSWEHVDWDDGRPVDGMRRSVLDGLVRLLAAMSADQPLLLVLDDLQWADPPSLRWLGYLAKRLADSHVTLVVTVREGDPLSERAPVREVTDCATHTLWLRPVSLASTRRMVHERFGEPGDEEFVLACHEMSGGNPMFLTSVLADMEVSGYRPRAAAAGAARSLLPSRLRDRITTWLASQPPLVRDFAKAMAVLGDHGDAELTGQVAELDPVGCAEAVRVLGRMGLVVASGAPPRFFHPAVRDAVEQAMTVTEADRLHRRAAALLHDGGYPSERVATHLLAVTGECDRWAVEVLRSSADTALSRGAPEAAARYLRRALLNFPSSSADRAVLLVDLATAETGFDPAAALRHISQAVPLLGSARERALAVARTPPALLATAPQPVIDVVARVAAELGDPARLPDPDRELALCLEARLRYARFQDPRQLPDAVDRLRDLGSGILLETRGERELAAVLLHAGTLTGGFPSVDAVRLGQRLLELEPASTAHAHAAVPLVITTLVAAGAGESVRSWLDLALERARQASATVPQAIIGATRSLVLLRAGRLAEARAMAAEALELTDPGWARPVSVPMVTLALVALESGDGTLAERILARTEDQGETVSMPWLAQLLRSWLAARAGEPAVALDHLLDCGRRLDRAGWRNPAVLPWRSWAGALRHTLGDQARAAELVRDEYERAVAWGAPAPIGRTLRVWGTITEGERGVEMLREAMSILRAGGDLLELSRVSATLDRRLTTTGSRRGRADGTDEPWFGARSGGPVVRTTLTKTERRVAALAAEGRTNQEIADEFGVSSRAVEKHLTNSYRKLNVQGRSGLAAALRDLG